MKTASFIQGLLVVCLLWASPSTALLRRDLEVEVESLKKQLKLVLQREEEYRKQVQDLDAKVSELLETKRQNQAEEGVALDQLQQDVATLTQKVEENRVLLYDINQRLAELSRTSQLEFSRLRDRVQLLEKVNGLTVGPGADVESLKPRPAGYKSVYDLAVEQYKAGKTEAALSQFEAFLQAYPDTELSDNALFMLGECYYQKSDYEQAIIKYDDVRRKYPEGNKAPNALFKMGLAFDKLGNRDTAVLFLKELIKKYPQTPEADQAQKQLEKWR